jgi:hypothetical protein
MKFKSPETNPYNEKLLVGASPEIKHLWLIIPSDFFSKKTGARSCIEAGGVKSFIPLFKSKHSLHGSTRWLADTPSGYMRKIRKNDIFWFSFHELAHILKRR